jgi:hypothetical protein
MEPISASLQAGESSFLRCDSGARGKFFLADLPLNIF